MHGLPEPRRHPGLWRASDRLLQVRMRNGVVKFDGLDAAEIVVEAGVLGVGGCGWECRLADELVGLVVQVGERVGAQEAVDQRSLGFVVVSQGRRTLSGEE